MKSITNSQRGQDIDNKQNHEVQSIGSGEVIKQEDKPADKFKIEKGCEQTASSQVTVNEPDGAWTMTRALRASPGCRPSLEDPLLAMVAEMGVVEVIPASKRSALYYWAKHRGEEVMAEKIKAVSGNKQIFRWISYKTYEMSDSWGEDPLKTIADNMSVMAEAMTATSWKQLLSLQTNILREVAEFYKTNMMERHPIDRARPTDQELRRA
ncbi:hypothetical protein S40288_10482 [Stachybotrys chartarum IBT 40288]|nr:hypothetical protein S40288_10482 [Stachybotrys chartarum IBT 40288]